MLEKFKLEDAHPVSVPAEPGTQIVHAPNFEDNNAKQVKNIPYRELIGSLLFVARVSHPDIEFAVNRASQYTYNELQFTKLERSKENPQVFKEDY